MNPNVDPEDAIKAQALAAGLVHALRSDPALLANWRVELNNQAALPLIVQRVFGLKEIPTTSEMSAIAQIAHGLVEAQSLQASSLPGNPITPDDFPEIEE
jgi:hypothetical protein